MNWFYSVWFSIIRYFHLWILSKEKHSKNYLHGFVIEVYHKDINNVENKTSYLGKNLTEAKQYLHKCKLKYNHINIICDRIEKQYNENPAINILKNIQN